MTYPEEGLYLDIIAEALGVDLQEGIIRLDRKQSQVLIESIWSRDIDKCRLPQWLQEKLPSENRQWKNGTEKELYESRRWIANRLAKYFSTRHFRIDNSGDRSCYDRFHK